jgi:hypothetical protein
MLTPGCFTNAIIHDRGATIPRPEGMAVVDTRTATHGPTIFLAIIRDRGATILAAS